MIRESSVLSNYYLHHPIWRTDDVIENHDFRLFKSFTFFKYNKVHCKFSHAIDKQISTVLFNLAHKNNSFTNSKLRLDTTVLKNMYQSFELNYFSTYGETNILLQSKRKNTYFLVVRNRHFGQNSSRSPPECNSNHYRAIKFALGSDQTIPPLSYVIY